MIRVLFVCLGNICRSPMAEGVFQQLVEDAGLSHVIAVDSAGTGSWHVGEKAHAGTRRVLAQHGINYQGRARVVSGQEVADDETLVVAMDADNMAALHRRYGDLPNLVRLLDFATNTSQSDVPDPYYLNNFEDVYELVEDGCRGLLISIIEKEGLGA